MGWCGLSRHGLTASGHPRLAPPPPHTPTQACNRQNMYCVPLYDSLGEHAIEYIIRHSEASIAFSSTEKFGTLAKSLPHVRALCVLCTGRRGSVRSRVCAAAAVTALRCRSLPNPTLH